MAEDAAPGNAIRWRVVVPILAVCLSVFIALGVFARGRTDSTVMDAGLAAATPSSTPEASPTPTTDERLRQILQSQADALLGGDLAGFLAPVPPANAALRADLTRRFGSLRALHVAKWQEVPSAIARQGPDRTWILLVRVRYCFVTTDCHPVTQEAETTWTVESTGPSLVAFGIDPGLIRPWEVGELSAAVGQRAIVAGPARYAARLPGVLAEAEKAAAIADRYGRWSRPPNHYLVFLATPGDWKQWYGGVSNPWFQAYTTRVDTETSEVMLNTDRIAAADLPELLRHEFGHAVAFTDAIDTSVWWLKEGFADYVSIAGSGARFDRGADLRQFLRSGQWSGDVALKDPPEDASATSLGGRYAIAYLAVRRIADRFGEDQMLAFFDLAGRKGVELPDAATSALGATWDDVAADCARYVRSRA